MIILDTNVLSELMRPSPDRMVVEWLLRRGSEGLRTTAICQAEVLAGIAALPESRRRRDLEQGASHVFSRVLGDQILPFGSDAASYFAAIVARRRNAGLAVEAPDAMIGAIALRHGAAVATRNVRDFADCGIVMHDPWKES